MNRKEAEKTRTIPFVFSDETRDTYNTVLSADKWDLSRFNKLGVAFYNHNSRSNDPDMTIGTARAWVENKKLVGEIRFEDAELNPIAEKVFRKVLSGTLRAVSVGFMPLERGKFGEGEEAAGGKRETYYYGKRELLEISITPLPANKNATVRSIGEDPIGETMERMYVDAEIRSFEEEPEPDTEPKDKERSERQADEDYALALDLMCRAAVVM
mgnify:CR=1 FL=1